MLVNDPQLITRTCILCRTTGRSWPLSLPPQWGWLESGNGREPVCSDCLWNAGQGGYNGEQLQRERDNLKSALTAACVERDRANTERDVWKARFVRDMSVAAGTPSIVLPMTEYNDTRAELARWKAAEERAGLQLAACARERDAYSEKAEKVSDLLKDVRLPGENALQALRRIVTAYQRQPKDGLA
jgi:hypothetical protein